MHNDLCRSHRMLQSPLSQVLNGWWAAKLARLRDSPAALGSVRVLAAHGVADEGEVPSLRHLQHVPHVAKHRHLPPCYHRVQTRESERSRRTPRPERAATRIAAHPSHWRCESPWLTHAPACGARKRKSGSGLQACWSHITMPAAHVSSPFFRQTPHPAGQCYKSVSTGHHAHV